jgi:hypothetical protein
MTGKTTDEIFFDRAVGRMKYAMAALGVAGTAAAWLIAGWSWGLGFLAGAGASMVNFHWLHRLTAALGAEMTGPRRRMGWYFALRYVLMGAGGYVIVRFFGFNLTAALLGLLVAVGAVIFEIFYELIYARA